MWNWLQPKLEIINIINIHIKDRNDSYTLKSQTVVICMWTLETACDRSTWISLWIYLRWEIGLISFSSGPQTLTHIHHSLTYMLPLTLFRWWKSSGRQRCPLLVCNNKCTLKETYYFYYYLKCHWHVKEMFHTWSPRSSSHVWDFCAVQDEKIKHTRTYIHT